MMMTASGSNRGSLRRRARRPMRRLADALRAANITPPVDCDATLASGSLEFEVKERLARDVDEPNPPSSWAVAEARAKRFRAILQRQTRAERYAETDKKWVGPYGTSGMYMAYVPWPRFHKKKGQTPKRSFLVNPATGEEQFAKEQDAIDLKFAWYDAGYPPGWIKPKKPKKRRRY